MGKQLDFKGDTSVLRGAFTTQVRVRYGETDAMGYVYYGNYPLFFEVGRNETMRHLGFTYGRMEEEDIMLPVVDLQIKYHTPAHYDDVLNVTSGILELRGASVVWGYRITRAQDDELIVWGTTTLAFVDGATRRPIRTPQRIIDAVL
ncbi:MAG: thioesterase [Bacteroidia bacterium]|nr:MAG: thioesterase [Bacteroidia bacterium]